MAAQLLVLLLNVTESTLVTCIAQSSTACTPRQASMVHQRLHQQQQPLCLQMQLLLQAGDLSLQVGPPGLWFVFCFCFFFPARGVFVLVTLGFTPPL